MKDLDETLRFAIANKRLLQFTYKGALRVAEPHDYGVMKGTTRLFVYQLRGSSTTPGKGVVGWKLLFVEEMSGCAVLEESFPGSRGASHQRHNEWEVLYARVT
jgi:hypothetical protein